MKDIKNSFIGTFNYTCPRCENRFSLQEMVMKSISQPTDKGLSFILLCKDCAKEGG